MTTVQMKILREIYSKHPIKSTELCKVMNLRRQELERLCSYLRSRGFIFKRITYPLKKKDGSPSKKKVITWKLSGQDKRIRRYLKEAFGESVLNENQQEQNYEV